MGNSLLGATPELIEDGLPDAAFKPIRGDDKNTCAALRKRNRTEREHGQRDLGFIAESSSEYGSLASRSRSIDHAPDDTLEDVHRKDAEFRSMQACPDYRRAQQIADAWCAAFVWPKRSGVVDPPTTDMLRRLDEGAKELAPAQQEEMKRIAARYQFFHWHLAFPEVSVGGGFDCVIGNPPWENIRADPKEFTGIVPNVSQLDATVTSQAPGIEQSGPTNTRIDGQWEEYRRQIAAQRHLIIASGRFPLGAHGKCNTMPLFLELFIALDGPKGRVGIIVKTVIGTDAEYQPIFRSVVMSKRVSSFLDFKNERGWFPGVHRQERFTLLTISPDGESPIGTFAFQLESPTDLHASERLLRLTTTDLEAMSGGSCRVPTITDPAQLHLLIAMASNSDATFLSTDSGVDNHIMLDGGKVSQSPGYCTSDSVMYSAGGREANNQHGQIVLPVYEGKLFGNVDHRLRTFAGVPFSARYGKTPSLPLVSEREKQDPLYMIESRYYISQDHVLDWLDSKGWRRQWLVLHSRKSNRENSRTFTISIAPRCASVDVAPIILPRSEVAGDYRPAVAATALGQSFVFDFLLRQRLVGFSIGKNLLKEIPAFRWHSYVDRCFMATNEALYDWLLKRVLELTYTAWELEPFARDCGWYGPPFRWDEARRFLMRCEIDAAFFVLYLGPDEDGRWSRLMGADHPRHGDTSKRHSQISRYFPSPRDALSYIMDTFEKVRSVDEASHGEYRTKRVILDVYDAMLIAAATGEPYRTVLDPPPADPSCCHSPRIAVLDLSGLTDGAWALPHGDQAGAETATLAAVLKVALGPAPIRTVRLTALLAMEPRLLTPSLSSEEASHWRRLVGPEATALESTTVPPRASANVEWGKAVRQLRGTGLLVEDLAAGTWGPGSGLTRIETGGWPDGRVQMVMEVLRRRSAEEVIRTLPANVRAWIDAEAA